MELFCSFYQGVDLVLVGGRESVNDSAGGEVLGIGWSHDLGDFFQLEFLGGWVLRHLVFVELVLAEEVLKVIGEFGAN